MPPVVRRPHSDRPAPTRSTSPPSTSALPIALPAQRLRTTVVTLAARAARATPQMGQEVGAINGDTHQGLVVLGTKDYVIDGAGTG